MPSENTPTLVAYLKGESLESANTACLSPFLLWFDVPTPSAVSQMSIDGMNFMYSVFSFCCLLALNSIYERCHEKTNNLHMQNQRRRSASQ